MAGNVCISSGSERTFCKIVPKNISVNGVMMPANTQDVKCDCFYKFGKLGYLKVNLTDASDSAFQEYILEFTAERDNMTFSINSKCPVYWLEPISLTAGKLYQVHVVNGIVRWVEVTPA